VVYLVFNYVYVTKNRLEDSGLAKNALEFIDRDDNCPSSYLHNAKNYGYSRHWSCSDWDD